MISPADTGAGAAVAALASLITIIITKAIKTPQEKRESDRLQKEQAASKFLEAARENLAKASQEATKLIIILEEMEKNAREKPNNRPTTSK